jgi:hypothetical protein
MKLRSIHAASLMVMAACSASTGDPGTGGVDSNPGSPHDASPGQQDAPAGGGSDAAGGGIPATITITGTTSTQGLGGATATTGVTVAAFKASDDSMVATTTSVAAGAFTLMVTTNGVALDGYLEGTQGQNLPTYLYPAKPLSADFAGAPVLLLTSGTLGLAATVGGTSQASGDGFIGVQVVDATGAKVAGAVVTSTPAGTVRYNGTVNGTPKAGQASTLADGIAYIFSVAPGTVTVTATKSGVTFLSHDVKARANAVTETLVSE